MGADKSDNAIGGKLFQLDLAAQPLQDNCGSTGRVSNLSLDLARLGYLSNNNLMHNPRELSIFQGDRDRILKFILTQRS
jgi:hypothetical protein